MKHVLVIYYSQTGQLEEIIRTIAEPLVQDPEVQVVFESLNPVNPFPFPWPFFEFLNVMPESVYLDPEPLNELTCDMEQPYDLIILGFTPWFLSPNLPMTAFLKSKTAGKLLKDKPVITVIGCRDMWINASEIVKGMLKEIGARHVDNVVLEDVGGNIASFVTTPRWMLTGKRDPFLWFPEAGILKEDIRGTVRLGKAILHKLLESRPITDSILRGLGAIQRRDKFLVGEHIGRRSFKIWGKIIRSAGGPRSRWRRPLLFVYVIYLVLMIVTLMPIALLLKIVLTPFLKNKFELMWDVYESPSGSDLSND